MSDIDKALWLDRGFRIALLLLIALWIMVPPQLHGQDQHGASPSPAKPFDIITGQAR
jgi:hypothetical protein